MEIVNIDKLARASTATIPNSSDINNSFKTLKKEIEKNNLEPLYDWFGSRKDKYYKIGWAYLYHHHDVEDVFQNTIMKVYENVNQLREERFFETWVTAIFINQCKKILKNREKVVALKDLERNEVEQGTDMNLELKEGLYQLDSNHREVLVLKYITGYSQEEIAEILSIPIGTVKSRIYRGLKLLRSNIEEVE
ncbi:RNA polymerase, sigma-24 subunit, ECF subfamily [Alkaliphilus oremlandii OhILAs]|uniref:RNA polymerase, sigma-24 subunit, ECF subfamily n=1 Tax=Alkaliphilus oremlandii (strain OhILAs) TaxID=350688 RepID=A8MM86_ALKOO|nr:RNA polymerase, sigma-24 subunit, ECF subfamily [Alkaliphilus oremlandii OhILAs]